MFYGLGFDPLDSAPGVIGVIVGVFVWLRHRRDRRARVFLALAASEVLLGILVVMAAMAFPESPRAIAARQAVLLMAALLSTAVFVHFAFAFPHARSLVRRGAIRYCYAGAVLVAAAAYTPALVRGTEGGETLPDVVLVAVSVLLLVACLAGVAATWRSYREMTRDERARYRVPVVGVLSALIASFGADVLLGSLGQTSDNRYVLWTANVIVLASELLLPLFFFMAASKYKLLEHHSQDYVAKL